MVFDRNTILILSGVIWGLAGFAIEVVPGGPSVQSMARLGFILISSTLLLSAVPIRISQKYYFSAILLTLYLISFIVSNIMHVASSELIFREIMLFYVLMVLFILISDEEHLELFTKGLFIALCSLIIFYFINVDLPALFDDSYRLATKLSANGIGLMATMLFIMLYSHFINIEGIWKKLIIVTITIMCIIVIISTRSRTAMIMFIASFLLINLQYKKWYALIILASIFILTYIIFTDEVSTILRLEVDSGVDTRGKNITNLTGRTTIWKEAFYIIKDNFFFGVGPTDAYTIVDGGRASFHNAFLQIWVSVGFMGLLPILILVFISFTQLFTFKHNGVYKIIFLIGLMGSISEAHFLNYGTPGNLLFLISLVYLGATYKRSTY